MIKILPETLSNKIAAGEVIDRPASVLKELLENAVDSHASEISVYLDGINIRVDDNGDGMSKEDMQLAIKRFATSKISSENDLENISTFGFRGEALPSIVSVSKTIIISKKDKQDFGYKIEIWGGKIINITEHASVRGTSIEVKDLFYNTPARLKFMKSYDTEYRYIVDVFEEISLVNPNIHFKFIKKGITVYDFFPEKSELRFRKILPKGDYKFLNIDYKTPEISISGFISSSEFSRSGKDYEYIFVNKRIISNNALSKAIIEGYSDFLDNNRYPIYSVFIELNPALVDVNVHPRKMEVKFQDLNKIYSIIKSEVSKLVTGSKSSSFNPQYMDKKINNTSRYDIKSSGSHDIKDYKQGSNNKKSESIYKENFNPINIDLLDIPIDNSVSDIFQIFNKFIITTAGDNLQIIDQHAASERVMYESIENNYLSMNIESQSFLIPYSIELNDKDFNIFSNNLDIFKKTGLEFEIFGDNIMKVSSLPLVMQDIDIDSFIQDLISDIKSEKFTESLNKEHFIIATIACHSSVRFGDRLDKYKMTKIVSDLKKCRDPYFCPHGRPTTYEIPLDELLKKFRRK